MRQLITILWQRPLDLCSNVMLINPKFRYRIFVMGLSRNKVYRKRAFFKSTVDEWERV
jgi:hypothetical protein